MCGSYIADDYYFYLDIGIHDLALGNTSIGKFTTERNNVFIQMKLQVRVDYTTEGLFDSIITMNFKKKICFLILSPRDFKDWLQEPDDHTAQMGPNWRFGDSNVYLKTDKSTNIESFRNTLFGFIHQAQGAIW